MESDGSPRTHSPSVDRLETLYRVSQALGSTLHLDTLLGAIMDQVIGVTHAERGFLMLGSSPDGLTFRVARGMDQTTIEAPEFQVSRGVVERVAREGKAVVTSDAQAEEWLAGRKSVVSLGLRSILCVPLQVRGKSIGVVYVDNRLQAGIFGPDDLDLLQAVGNTAAVAIENARLHEREIEQARLERELEVARQIQTSLMPHVAPALTGFDIAGFWRVARQVGGDFYDFVPRPEDRLRCVEGECRLTWASDPYILILAITTMDSPCPRIQMSAHERSALKDSEFVIMIVLANGDNHGYAIMKSIRENVGDHYTIGPATLYRSIKRMLGRGLIFEVEDRPDPHYRDERRRYYRLTSLGRKMLAAEAQRREHLVALARSQRIGGHA